MPCKKEEDEVNIFEEQEDYYQFLNTLDMMALSYEPNGTPFGRNYILYVNDMAYFVTLLRYIHQNPVKAGMVSEVKDL